MPKLPKPDARTRGYGRDSADIARRIESVLSLADGSGETEARQLIAAEIGTDVAARESVPGIPSSIAA